MFEKFFLQHALDLLESYFKSGFDNSTYCNGITRSYYEEAVITQHYRDWQMQTLELLRELELFSETFQQATGNPFA
jgi:hypothetical protein